MEESKVKNVLIHKNEYQDVVFERLRNAVVEGERPLHIDDVKLYEFMHAVLFA